MDLSGIFLSWPGQYLTQSFLHSLVAGAVAEIAVKAWGIGRPSVRQRFLLAAILFPALSFPLYRLTGAARDSLRFRLDALFDSGRWVALELPGGIPLGAGLILLFLVTSAVFVAQELVPVLRHSLASGREESPPLREGEDPRVREALASLPANPPAVHVIEDEDLMIFSSTGRNAAVYLSTGLLAALGRDELRAALAHEIAHVLRGRRPFLSAVFVVRVLMFFNPVVLMEFRRAVQEDEKICDEVAVSFTGDAASLVSTLRKLYLDPDGAEERRRARSLADVGEELERYSHRLNIQSRIARLRRGYPATGEEWFAFAATLLAVVSVSYYVV